jgi:hypothetical protein
MTAMTDDGAPKSAYELAMERLRKKDAEEGIERKPVTDAQRASIAEVRNFYESKLAEIDVLHQGRMRTLMEPEAREVAEQEFRRERERLAGERDAKVEKIRRQ